MKYEAWVASFVQNLAGYFNLAGWRVEVEFSPEDDGNTYAKIVVNSDYQVAYITLLGASKRDFDEGNFDRLVMSVVHEMVHIFLDPFNDAIAPHLSEATSPWFSKIIEAQTQKLTMVLLKTLPKPLIPPRPKKNGKLNPAPKNNKQKPADDPQQSADLHGAG